MPQKHVLSEDAQEAIVREAAEQQQAMMEAQSLEIAGKAAPGLGKAPEKGSVMAEATVP
jgi:hypothetical protein